MMEIAAASWNAQTPRMVLAAKGMLANKRPMPNAVRVHCLSCFR